MHIICFIRWHIIEDLISKFFYKLKLLNVKVELRVEKPYNFLESGGDLNSSHYLSMQFFTACSIIYLIYL